MTRLNYFRGVSSYGADPTSLIQICQCLFRYLSSDIRNVPLVTTLTATLVPEISSASCGSIPAPRFRVSALCFPLLDSAWPSACSADSSAPSSPRRLPVSVRRFSLVPISPLAAFPYCSSLSFPIWPPPVETSRLGDISIVVTSSHGDISNVAAWGHYQSRATYLLRFSCLRFSFFDFSRFFRFLLSKRAENASPSTIRANCADLVDLSNLIGINQGQNHSAVKSCADFWLQHHRGALKSLRLGNWPRSSHSGGGPLAKQSSP